MYNFSLPMPFQKENIDRLIRLNENIIKSKITSLYFALPSNCPTNCGVEQNRMFLDFGNDFNYWKELIKYSLSQGFDFIYLLNSPHSFYTNDLAKLDLKLKKLHNLLLILQDIGVDKVRVGNTQVINYIRNNYPDFKIYASTSLEYENLKQYTNFFSTFPEVKKLVPGWNNNRNFKLLKNLKTKFPDVEIEIMADASCISGCPFRHCHDLANSHWGHIFNNIHPEFTSNIFSKLCHNIAGKNVFIQVAKSNVIYPWEIEAFSKIGINNFKFTGRYHPEFRTGEYLRYYEMYLKGVDDIKNIENEKFYFLNLHCLPPIVDIKVKEIKPYLPDINYFIKNGHLCSSRCGVECTYCEECARKLEEKFGDRLEFLKKGQ